MRKFLIFLLCAVIMRVWVPPVNAQQVYTYNYDGLVITSTTDISNYLSEWYNNNYHNVTLDNTGQRINITLSGTTTSTMVSLLVRGYVDITLDNLTMITHYVPLSLGSDFNGTLSLKGNNTLIALEHDTATHGLLQAGLELFDGAEVSIAQHSGSEPGFLFVKGAPGQPGIRVGSNTLPSGTTTFGKLNIYSGTVTALSGRGNPSREGSAAIGGEYGENGGIITIYGGFVTAIGNNSAGIGGGNSSENGGEIEIRGGTVIAVGGTNAAGIGGGNGSNGGSIVIRDGFVTAAGGNQAAGIGGGNNGHSGNIRIYDGTVIAKGGGCGAGIGGGHYNNNKGGDVKDEIRLVGGKIFASGGDCTNHADGTSDSGGVKRQFGYGEDIGVGCGGRIDTGAISIAIPPSGGLPHIIADPPPAVFMRNDKLFWTKYSYEPGYSIVHNNMNYERISSYGIRLTDLFLKKDNNGKWPEIRGDLPENLPDEAKPEEIPEKNYLETFWSSLINHWKEATNAGAWLMLNSIKYHINSQDTNTYIQSQHKGTKGEVLYFNQTNLENPLGYSFDTWNTQNGVQYNPGTEYTFNQDLDLYAQWKANTYTVKLHKNIGDGTYETAEFTYDKEEQLPTNPFARDGYTFAGWATAPDGSVGYSDGESVINLAESGEINLYARWTPIIYKIDYVLDGGKVSPPNPETYTVETPEFELKNPTKTGYIFAGWSVTGTTGDPVMKVTIPTGSMGDRSYTAHWTLPFRTLTDSAMGISVSGYIRDDAALTVSSIVLGNDPACNAIRQRMNDDDNVLLLGKDISLSQCYAGKLTITIPVGTKYNGKTVTILHCAGGTLKTYTVKVSDGTAVFHVTTLSPFAVFASAEDGIPGTGDSSAPWVWWLLGGVSGVGIVILAVLSKGKKTQRRV